jgi:hypothetical protein
MLRRRLIARLGRRALSKAPATRHGAKGGSTSTQTTCSSTGTKRGFTAAAGGGGILASYGALLESHPIPTKAATSSVIVGLGDIFCQLGIEKRSFSAPSAAALGAEPKDGEDQLAFDYGRLGRMGFLGCTLIGPVLHYWYGFLYRTLPAQGNLGAFQRMAMDQICFAPPYIAVFVASLFVLEGKSELLPAYMSNSYVDNLLTNYLIWVPAQLLNFRFIPAAYNVLFSNLTALVWNTYLSWSAHKDH